MRALGAALLSLGCLAAAWLAAQDATEMRWWPYLAALALSVAGVVVMRLGERGAARAESKVTREVAALEAAIGRIVRNIEELDARKAEMSPYDAFGEVDRLFAEDLAAFAAARGSIVHSRGLEAYAAVMNEFAAGERHLNRVWSASVDGYVDEVRDYIGRAREQFIATRDLVVRRSSL